jgi:membrane protease YdiL (CAAX protease family)
LVEILNETVVPLFRTCEVWQLAGIAMFAGFGEEMLFRGVIQNSVASLFEPDFGAVAGLVAASLLFGVLHWLTLTYAILAALIGLYLGGLWIATGNLLVPAVVHAVYDFWVLVYLIKIRTTRK